MSATIATLADAEQEQAIASGELERLQANIERARRAGDAVLVLELREREKLIRAHVARAEAVKLTLQLESFSEQRARLNSELEAKQEKQIALSAKIQEMADEIAELQAEHFLINFERESAQSELLQLTQRERETRGQLAALTESM
jgi:chromosome segregation ATPase